MDYKEKFEETKNWIKSIYPDLSHGQQIQAEAFFPELKESEDDKTRKEILDFIIQYSNGTFNLSIHDFTFIKWIAWLEKQGTSANLSEERENRFVKGLDPNEIFDYIGDFNEGFAEVSLNGKYNFINQEGKLLSSQWFDRVSGFDEGYAWVRLNDKHNLIDTEGNFISEWSDYDNTLGKCVEKQDKKDKLIKELIAKLNSLDYPYVTGWRKNYKDNKPKVKHSVLMLTNHGVAEGEWLGDEWCQYRWSCKIKDEDVLYWLHLSDLENLEKEDELKELVWEFSDKSSDAYKIILNKWKTLTDEDKNKYNKSIDFNDSSDK